MRTKYFLMIVIGTLACLLVMDGWVLQPLMTHDSNLVYAMGGRHHREYPYPGQPGDQGYEGEQGDQGYQENLNFNSADSIPVPEPSTILLLVSGLLGLAGYGRKKFFKK